MTSAAPGRAAPLDVLPRAAQADPTTAPADPRDDKAARAADVR